MIPTSQINHWRRSQRHELLEKRTQLSRDQRNNVQSSIIETLHDQVPQTADTRIGFYWPIKAEIDLRNFITDLLKAGAQAALPVVVEKAAPVEFWNWQPGIPMQTGIWNIPIPKQRQRLQPTVLLIPLVGFDNKGYRLGYGGGYYDRTLEQFNPTPLKIGIGFHQAKLPTIHPQPHDIPMDLIVTEAGLTRFNH